MSFTSVSSLARVSSSGCLHSSGMRRTSSAGNLQAAAAAAALATPSRLSRVPRGLPRATSQGGALHALGAAAGVAAAAAAVQRSEAGEGPTTEATGASTPQASSASPYASLTRVFLIGQPSNFMRNLAGRKSWRALGPSAILLFAFACVLGLLTAVRSVLVKRVKSCACCRGYGIVRCRLCNGDGSVEWRGAPHGFCLRTGRIAAACSACRVCSVPALDEEVHFGAGARCTRKLHMMQARELLSLPHTALQARATTRRTARCA
jgi:hypothetical protein